MAILIDTNVLLRSVQPHHPHFAAAERALTKLRAQNDVLCVTPQNLIEFWAVATWPLTSNGLGISIEAASRELGVIKRLFSLLPDSPLIFQEWERLAVTHKVSGKGAHDARIVAAMLVHGLTRILTFNSEDF